MDEIHIYYDEETLSLWDFPDMKTYKEGILCIITEDVPAPIFDFPTQMQQIADILTCLRDIEYVLALMIGDLPFFKNARRFVGAKFFGTLDYVRI